MSDGGFEAEAEQGTRGAGLPLGEGDIDVLRLIAGAFNDAMQALDSVDLTDLPLEPDLDPSRPPRRRGDAG
jgi:hypothetical protein